MKPGIHSRAARVFAILAVLVHALLPGSLAVAEAKSVDLSRYICAPGGPLSATAQAAAAQLAAVLIDEAPERDRFEDHCPLCTLGVSTPPPQRARLSEPTALAGDARLTCDDPALALKPQGAPLGSRGPPFRH